MTQHLAHRRSFARESVRWRAEISTPGATLEAEVRDISAVGAFVVAPTPLVAASGERLRLRIFLPWDRQVLDVDATVRWRGKSVEHGCEGLGVQFDDVEQRIAAFLDDTGTVSDTQELPIGTARVLNPQRDKK